MELENYIKSELLVLVPVLYLIGMALKKSTLPDKWIPFVLGGIAILLSTLWTLANTDLSSWQSVLTAVFTGIVQGILVAGASVYANQLVKQAGKEE